MRSDPRCPSCGEKISATATWCMHCGEDVAAPVDGARGGAPMDPTPRDAGRSRGSGSASASADDGVEAAQETLLAGGLGVGALVVVAMAVPMVGATGLVAILGAAALVAYLRQRDDPVEMAIRAGYGTAGLVVFLRAFAAWATAGAVAFFDVFALLVVAALVGGAQWVDDNRDRLEAEFEAGAGGP